MTHDELTRRAVRWLKGTMRCGVVLSEVCGAGSEQPDAIGWKSAGLHTVLVEVKVSRADFLRDKKKWHRQGLDRMGHERFFFTPPGLVKIKELPEGWGLAEAGKRVRVLHRVTSQIYDFGRLRREVALLFSALRKTELGLPLDWLHKELTEKTKEAEQLKDEVAQLKLAANRALDDPNHGLAALEELL